MDGISIPGMIDPVLLKHQDSIKSFAYTSKKMDSQGMISNVLSDRATMISTEASPYAIQPS